MAAAGTGRLAWRRLARRRLGWPGGRWGLGGRSAARGALCLWLRLWPYGYGGYGGCTSYAPIYDAYGNYLGQQLVNGC